MSSTKASAIERYPALWRLLHLISAIVIIWATLSGLYLAFGDIAGHTKKLISNFNLALTLLFIPFFTLRTLIMLCWPKPKLATLSARQQSIADHSHNLLYWLVALLLLSGVLMLEHSVDVFGLFQMAAMINNKELLQVFFIAHKVLSYLLTAWIILHLLAVIKHQRQGIPILGRML